MRKAEPWSIDGIKPDIREAARQAARRQGMSLSEWLHDIILTEASDLGVEVEDMDADDRLEAVAARLHQLGDRDHRQTQQTQTRQTKTRGRDRLIEDEDIAAELASVRRPNRSSTRDTVTSRRNANRPERWRDRHREEVQEFADDRRYGQDPEELLDAAVNAFERSIAKSQRQTVQSFEAVAKLIKSQERQRGDDYEVLSDISDRLSDIEQRMKHPAAGHAAKQGRDKEEHETLPAVARRLAEIESHFVSRSKEDGTQPIRSALARLESRLEEKLDTLSHRPMPAAQDDAAKKTALPPLDDAGLKQLEARLEERLEALARKATPAASDDAGLKRLESKLDALLQSSALSTASDQSQKAPAKSAWRDSLEAAVAEIGQKQRVLNGETPRRKAPFRRAEASRVMASLDRPSFLSSPGARPSSEPAAHFPDTYAADLTALQRDIAKLSSKLEEMRPQEVAKSLNRVETGIGTMSAGIADLAPRDSVTAIEAAIRNLTARIEASREFGTRETLLKPLAEIADDLRHSLGSLDQRPALDGLEREIRTIGAKLESMSALPREPEALKRLQAQTQEMHELLKAVAAHPQPPQYDDSATHRFDAIERQSAFEAIEREIKTIGAKLETMGRAPQEPAALKRIQEQTQEIHDLLTSAAAHPLPFEQIEHKVALLAEQIERQRTMGPASSEDDFTSSRLERIHVESLGKIEDQLEHLSRKFEQAMADRSTRAATIDHDALDSVVQTLADKFAAAQQPQAGQQAFEALQRQIGEMAQRLEKSDSGFALLGTLQRSVNELFAHLDETRYAANEAAHSSAQNAAREAIHELMRQPGFANDPAYQREIMELRNVQDEADRRTHSTLNAVHETLEKIVDRLAMLEEEIGEAKEVSLTEARLSGQNAMFERYRESEAAASRQKSREPVTDDQPRVRVDPAIVPDILIEPGAGFKKSKDTAPLKNADMRPAAGRMSPAAPSEPGRSRSDFIAAARRAAQAAQDDLMPQPAPAAAGRPRIAVGELAGTSALSSGLFTQTRDFFVTHKRQLTLSIAALFLAVGAYAVIRTMEHTQANVSGNTPPAVHTMLEPKDSGKAGTRAAAHEAQNMFPQPGPRDPAAQRGGASLGPLDTASRKPEVTSRILPSMAAAPMSKAPQAPIAGSDPIVTGSITSPKNMVPQLAPNLAAAAAAETPAMFAALRDHAEAGDAIAQYELATRYAEGKIVTRDFKIAADWYEKAATQGVVPAQYRLGSLYEKGLGVTRDLVRAKTFYEKAANQGHSHAMHNLAVLTAEGVEGKPDYADAAIWFRKAAEYGIRDSQYNLAILYARGLGVQQDLVQSYMWFAVAAAQGDDDAGKKRDDVAMKLDAKALSQAKTLVEAFHPRETDRAVNEVQVPPGGWTPMPQAAPKTGKAKISLL